MSIERQAEGAIRHYEAKSWEYDSTWHNSFTKRFNSYLKLQPGQKILDLACGTGLLTFLESEAVGPTGAVIGIDVTPGMLALASRKKEANGDKYKNVSLYKGDILHLEEIQELEGQSFDAITVASALVLFPDPKAAIEHWSQFLKPGGILAVDSTHPRNLVSGMVLERVARRLNLPIGYNRSWSKSESSLRNVLESAGLEVDRVVTVDNQAGYGRRYHDLDAWDDFFVENVIVKDVARTFASNDIRREAQSLYKEEWGKLAIDGKVEEVDAVFLGIARKRQSPRVIVSSDTNKVTAADGSRYVSKKVDDEVVFKGGCRCGQVQYTASETPSNITLCHCRACQQVSGSDYLPFVHIPKAALKFTKSDGLKSLHLSSVAERTFCSACGAPISMAYSFLDSISLTMGSTDATSFTCDLPRVHEHIFLREKAPWVTLPEDGTVRWGTMEEAHLLGDHKPQ